MNFTTLCYIEKENKYLMLHRTSKKKDGNKDKWIGESQMGTKTPDGGGCCIWKKYAWL